MAAVGRMSQFLGALDGADVSRATSPGGEWRGSSAVNGSTAVDKQNTTRPRTFPIRPPAESPEERERNLNTCIENLYIAVSAGDFTPGAVHWTRQIRGWMSLKFDLPRSTRVQLAKLYYELALAPGVDHVVTERFASMFMVLTKYVAGRLRPSRAKHFADHDRTRRKHYVRPGRDLALDWAPLFRQLKVFVLPSDSGQAYDFEHRRNIRTLTKLCTFAQMYFDPSDIPAMFHEFLPYFTTSFVEGAFVVIGLLNLLLPTQPAPEDAPQLHPQAFLPTLFHLWALLNRSKVADADFVDLLSRLARDSLTAEHIPFSEYGIFTAEQSALVFTAVLRLLEIPVGQATSVYSSVDTGIGLAFMLDRDSRKHPLAHHMARWVVMSLSPACLEHQDSTLSKLEGLISSIETFFHPSNNGHWTRELAQMVFYLADFFVMRWNRERNAEIEVPPSRRLNPAIRRRFVLCLREVVFMGIFAKSGTAMSFALASLQCLAFLEPTLILPGALQRIYPAMQGLSEVHRTISAIRALHMLSKTMARTKGYRCHVTTLLGLALPGIDANDLDKTMNTLAYLQGVCYTVPFCDLTKVTESGDKAMASLQDAGTDTDLARRWVAEQVERLESSPADVEVDYDQELSDGDEDMILRSSTTGLAEFLLSFLGRIFTLLENMPDSSRVRSGSPEESVTNTLPAALTPLLASLSPELFDLALDKIANFITNHVIHQARDAMAFICNGLVKISPERSLKRLIPDLIASIRTEIDDNGAGSTRTTGAEILPRDRALVWHIGLLSMSVVHVGDAVLAFKDELFDIAEHMQRKCRGIPTVHVSNFIHHLLLALTGTYTVDYSIFEQEELDKGLSAASWGNFPNPRQLHVKWHTPSAAEIEFAVQLFASQSKSAMEALHALVQPGSSIKRDGIGKDWSDEVSRNLVLLRLLISGICVLFDSSHAASEPDEGTGDAEDRMDEDEDEDAASQGDDDAESARDAFVYPTGYPLQKDEKNYELIHEIRRSIGETLHDVHRFLIEKQEDDVPCFNALYTAYRSWFIDVGIERSAHALDRVTRLLNSDIQPFKFSGLRKEYPRPLLVRRANVYHLQRLRHNAHARPRTDLDSRLLLDLAESSVSLYTEIRRNAQTANESAVKCVLGARPFVIPSLLDAMVKAVDSSDFPRMKGAIFSLFFGSLAKTITRNWKFAPTLIKAFVRMSGADKPSIQQLSTNAMFHIIDIGRPLDRMVILDKEAVERISFAVGSDAATVQDKIRRRRSAIQTRRVRIEEKQATLSNDLVDIARTSHWKQVSRTGPINFTLGLRYDSIASEAMTELVTKGAVDPHPSLRTMYAGALISIFCLIQTRALTEHSYEKYLLNEETWSDRVHVPTQAQSSGWTKEFLASFAQPKAKYYIDADHPGWLVWDKTMPGFLPEAGPLDYDEVEQEVRAQLGQLLDRRWFATYFDYIKQEPRDAHSDRLRMSNCLLLTHSFHLIFEDIARATFDDIKDLASAVYGDGSDKHQHRAFAEIMGALLACAPNLPVEQREAVWQFVFPLVREIFTDGMTAETSTYWMTFLHFVLQSSDPRRNWPLVDWLSSFRLDMKSNAAFKERTRIALLQQCVVDTGWHFQLEPPVLADLLQHLDHPYKGVREAMGTTIAQIYRTRYHESYSDVQALMKAQSAASSIGVRPYEPTPDFSAQISDVFARLAKWREERPPGQQTPSSYTSGSKTVLLWLESTLCSQECTQLVGFFSNLFLEELLYMMDIKEDPELQSLAYLVFRHLPNIPHRAGEDADFIAALIRVGRDAAMWHQRMRVLILIQVHWFRRLFLMSVAQQEALFNCVSAMLYDAQIEVRMGAATTLSGMIRCSPVGFRDGIVASLDAEYSAVLDRNPLPKKRVAGTPTPEHNARTLKRHAAVLGLGALVQAFPYASPPPPWLPAALARLARQAAADPGMVGKSVKSVLADFKKTRQDTWHVDVKVRRFYCVREPRLTCFHRRSSRTSSRTWRACCGRATLREGGSVSLQI